MKNSYSYLALLVALLFSLQTIAQSTTVNGSVKSSRTNEPLTGVTILVKGTGQGTSSDEKGNFKITTAAKLPLTITVSYVGYASQDIVVSSSSQTIDVSLDVAGLAQEVTVSASRTPERILESPVSIERVNAAAIRNSPASTYYDVIGNLKGVDLVTASLLFKTPSTRGFNTSGNLRLNQLVDGMDNQAPGLNFAVGTLSGVTELDVESLELLSGASSALYGPGGMNGTLLINSKNPFKYQGLSFQVKQGVLHVDNYQRRPSPFYDWTLRWAKQVSDKFAFKVGGSLTQTKDWVGNDYRNYLTGADRSVGTLKEGDRNSDPNYDGVNVYGDETTANLQPALQNLPTTTPVLGVVPLPGNNVPIPTAAALAAFTGGRLDVSRTGYKESDVVDPTTLNVKLHAALHYKITPGIEASLVGYFGYGSTVYTGSDRYSLKGVKIGQYKLEVTNKNWFVRAYTTQEDAGESFNATVTTRLFNEAWKPSATAWYPQFIQGLAAGAAQAYGQALGAAYAAALGRGESPTQALASAQAAAPAGVTANRSAILAAARTNADQGMPVPGTQQFKDILKAVSSKPISQGGGLFLDKSSLYMTEGQYNLTDAVKSAEVLVGADYKQYVLNSEGTLFADTAGRIRINEVGAYAQVSKRILNERMKLSASGRYDKQSNFKGRFTPRFSAVITAAKDHNVRLSYQTAYRFPSTQNQWINLVVAGGVRLIGGVPQLKEFYNFAGNPVYTLESFSRFSVTRNAADLQVQQFPEYKPESAQSYEVGYKGLIRNKLLIDVYAYRTKYENFLGRIAVAQSKDGTVPGLSTPNLFSVSVNSTSKVNTQGWGASVEYLLPRNFTINANLYSDEIKNVPTGFIAYYNAPKYRSNISFGNTGMFAQKRVGFNVTWRYQDGVNFQGDFGSGYVPAFMTFDGQVSYKFPQTKSIVKLGATNLFNQYYRNAFGNPEIGGLYYLSFGYNIF
ncbi:TonB-dependent receptor [Segetibacter sp. 3557_3]|uniref:TonB-dependent receptor n=1 Tax=Segetibacter sp. 3557_3 TaxID=2547429 RepID=UPI001058DCA4|nr:TonB-dependent receptor [Segetibacter sp. 3557_3]TDH28803.1 TonB-dependent receptor [Segetibacter sp. 3557_3]